MKTKIINSNVLKGKQTTDFYETKYYLRYLQFLFSMINGIKNLKTNQKIFIHIYKIKLLVKNCEKDLSIITENETSLSLLQDSYASVYTLACHFLQSSANPTKILSQAIVNTEKNANDDFFFGKLRK